MMSRRAIFTVISIVTLASLGNPTSAASIDQTAACRGPLKAIIETGEGRAPLPKDQFQVGYCYATVEMLLEMGRYAHLCIPMNVNNGTVWRVVYDYIAAHPDENSKSFMFTVMGALQSVWGCNFREKWKIAN